MSFDTEGLWRVRFRIHTPAERAREPGGAIGFAISAVMSEALAEALRKVPEADWKTFGKEEDGKW